MKFGGAYSRVGKGAGIIIISPEGKVFTFAFRLEFEATNNVVEYEALLLDIEKIKSILEKATSLITLSRVVWLL